MLLEKLIAAPPGEQTAMDKILPWGQLVYVHSMENEFKVPRVLQFFSLKWGVIGEGDNSKNGQREITLNALLHTRTAIG